MARFKEITFQPLMPTGSYLNARIGVTIELEDGNDPMIALQAAKNLADEFHKQQYPQLYENGKPLFVPQSDADIPHVQVEKTPEQQSANLIAEIYSCKNLVELNSFRLVANNDKLAIAACDIMHKKLSNNQNDFTKK